MFKKITVYLLLASLMSHSQFSWAGDRDTCWDFDKSDGKCTGHGEGNASGASGGDKGGSGHGDYGGKDGDMSPGDLRHKGDHHPEAAGYSKWDEANKLIARAEEILSHITTQRKLSPIEYIVSQLRPHVQMEQGAIEYIQAQLRDSQIVADNAFELTNGGAAKGVAQLLSDFAIDSATSINSFLDGVQAGTYGGFVTASEAIGAISKNPKLVLNLSKNIVHLLSGGPGTIAATAHDALEYVANEIWEFEVSMTGSAEQRGRALGELGSNLLISLATVEALPGAKSLERIAGKVAGNEGLGTALNQGMRESATIGPELSATDIMIRDGRAAVMRNLEQCKAIRTGYRNEMRGISETAQRMLGEGQSEEIVARHVHAMRREIGIKYKELTPLDVRQHIYDRNILDNSDVLGPSIEELRAGRPGRPPKTWREIIHSSSRSNKKIDLFFDELGE